jgi:hypothetical protein
MNFEKEKTKCETSIEFKVFPPEELQDVAPMAPLSSVRVGDHFYMQIFKNNKKEEN